VRPSTSIDASAEAGSKAADALAAVEPAGYAALVASTPATVRWLLCGRGRPVDSASPEAAYTVVLLADRRYVLLQDIEASRVEAEERFEELGYESVAFPWHAGLDETLRALLGDAEAASDRDVEPVLASLRRRLAERERERYRAAAQDCAGAVVETLDVLRPDVTEYEAAAELALRCQRRGLFPGVLLAAGNVRQKLHRHPLPTDAALGRHGLLAVTAERDGLHVSLTRLVSFGPVPHELDELVRAAAAVDAAILRACRPGATLGELLDVAAAAYADRGFPDEWRRHHQGGLTGYKGREVFAVPREETPLPACCAVAWNPSIAGGAKSEDTVIVTEDGLEVLTRTPLLPEVEIDGLARPAVLEVS
jgi:Xaa-Pro dipeptidase